MICSSRNHSIKCFFFFVVVVFFLDILLTNGAIPQKLLKLTQTMEPLLSLRPWTGRLQTGTIWLLRRRKHVRTSSSCLQRDLVDMAILWHVYPFSAMKCVQIMFLGKFWWKSSLKMMIPQTDVCSMTHVLLVGCESINSECKCVHFYVLKIIEPMGGLSDSQF